MTAGSEQLTRAMQSLEALFLIGVEGVTEIWLVRHADCYQAMSERTDPPLSPLGRDQAKRLAERARRATPAAVYSSPLRRSVETAKAISDHVHVDERLVEMELDVNDDGSLDIRESPANVVARMAAAVDAMIERHHGERIVAVSHGAAIMAYLTDVLQLDYGRLRMYPYFTSISVVRVLGDRRMVGAVGDVGHLE
ncbi:MAG: histidine phosphatase family protein [Candidatus Dormibacteraceae bacterium]